MQGSDRKVARGRRHRRVRKKIMGTPTRPRLAVFRSARHIYAQLVDDVSAVTLASAGSLDEVVSTGSAEGGKVGVASAVGRVLAERAREKGISDAVFDRGGYKYHGRVAALADAAREGGLNF